MKNWVILAVFYIVGAIIGGVLGGVLWIFGIEGGWMGFENWWFIPAGMGIGVFVFFVLKEECDTITIT